MPMPDYLLLFKGCDVWRYYYHPAKPLRYRIGCLSVAGSVETTSLEVHRALFVLTTRLKFLVYCFKNIINAF